MAFIHTLSADGALEIGEYTITLETTDPGSDPRVRLEVSGPDGSEPITLDRATWYLPEVDQTRPNSPQYVRENHRIHVGIAREGNVGHGSVELAVEAPPEVPITVLPAAE